MPILHTVSPTEISASPAIATMSPAWASVISILLSPKKPNKEILKNIIYIKDLDKFENHKYTTDSDLKPGDIIYGTGHCAIVDIVDKNNVKIFDWSRRVENNLTKSSVNIYYPDVLNEGNYYTGYWRLK